MGNKQKRSERIAARDDDHLRPTPDADFHTYDDLLEPTPDVYYPSDDDDLSLIDDFEP